MLESTWDLDELLAPARGVSLALWLELMIPSLQMPGV